MTGIPLLAYRPCMTADEFAPIAHRTFDMPDANLAQLFCYVLGWLSNGPDNAQENTLRDCLAERISNHEQSLKEPSDQLSREGC